VREVWRTFSVTAPAKASLSSPLYRGRHGSPPVGLDRPLGLLDSLPLMDAASGPSPYMFGFSEAAYAGRPPSVLYPDPLEFDLEEIITSNIWPSPTNAR
jgi:hypothetical protein